MSQPTGEPSSVQVSWAAAGAQLLAGPDTKSRWGIVGYSASFSVAGGYQFQSWSGSATTNLSGVMYGPAGGVYVVGYDATCPVLLGRANETTYVTITTSSLGAMHVTLRPFS